MPGAGLAEEAGGRHERLGLFREAHMVLGSWSTLEQRLCGGKQRLKRPGIPLGRSWRAKMLNVEHNLKYGIKRSNVNVHN